MFGTSDGATFGRGAANVGKLGEDAGVLAVGDSSHNEGDGAVHLLARNGALKGFKTEVNIDAYHRHFWPADSDLYPNCKPTAGVTKQECALKCTLNKPMPNCPSNRYVNTHSNWETVLYRQIPVVTC